MVYTIDEIYDMLAWDSGMEEKGIEEGKKLRNLYPFIQPNVPGKSKSVWENCAKIIVSKTDEELKPYLFSLFEWLQDMNWPGAMEIFDRLSKIPFDVLEIYYQMSVKEAKKTKDNVWLMILKDFL